MNSCTYTEPHEPAFSDTRDSEKIPLKCFDPGGARLLRSWFRTPGAAALVWTPAQFGPCAVIRSGQGGYLSFILTVEDRDCEKMFFFLAEGVFFAFDFL